VRLSAAGVPTVLLKGLPLAVAYYPSIAARPMTDLDMLIPPVSALEAADVMERAGYALRGDVRWPPQRTASSVFVDGDAREIDLHIHIVHECLEPDADEAAWRRAVPIDIGVTAFTLCAEDHLLHAIAPGMRPDGLAPIRWVADAMVLLRTTGDRFDWMRLWNEARRRRLLLAVREALSYLSRRFHVAIPADALQRFAAAPVDLEERCEFWLRQVGGEIGLASRACEYLRAKRRGDYPGPFGAFEFLRDAWMLRSAWAVPGAACARALSRLNSPVSSGSRDRTMAAR